MPQRPLIRVVTAVAALAAGAAVIGRLLLRRREAEGEQSFVALAPGEGPIRSAGPEGMRTRLNRRWTDADEASDESFPASDPPAYP